MKQINNSRPLIFIAGITLIFGVVFGSIGIYVIYEYHPNVFSSWHNFTKAVSNQITNNLGDFLWGGLSVLFTFTATIFLFISFKEQREQLQKTKEESDKTRFETTFFNILSMLKPVQDTVNSNIKNILKNDNGIIDYYLSFVHFYRDSIAHNLYLKELSSTFEPTSASSSEIEIYKAAVIEIYENFIKETKCNISYLYRYLYNTIRFVIDDPYNKIDKLARNRYLNLLQSQLSNEELCLLFYNALSKHGEDKDGHHVFKQILDNTQFLENIDPIFLLNKNQYVFYPHTIFKFLNRHQIEHVKTK